MTERELSRAAARREEIASPIELVADQDPAEVVPRGGRDGAKQRPEVVIHLSSILPA